MKNKLWQEFVIDTDLAKNKDVAAAIGKAVLALTEQEYVCKIYHEGLGIYAIEYEHDEEHAECWGGPTLTWLEEEEQEIIDDYRAAKQLEGRDKGSNNEDADNDEELNTFESKTKDDYEN